VRVVPALVSTVLISGSLLAQIPASAKTMKNPVTADAKSIEAGKAAYTKANCAACHGAAGKGDGAIVKSMKPDAIKPSNFTDAKRDHGTTDGEWFHVIKEGISPTSMMKAQKTKLADADIWNVVNYLKSLAPKS
jgi:mono/diheme cytochrome c family protein